MSARRKGALFGLAVSVVAAGMTSLVPIGPAFAQGIFESFFGGLRRAIERPAPPQQAFADPFTSLARALNPPPRLQRRQARGDDAPAKGFCVRTCDGQYFPVRANAGASAAETCHAFCPASETRLYSGSNIDYATAPDGSRYADLSNAYLYRKHLVAGCTCNGRDAFGLAHIDINSDPTLKPGDVVATKSGLMAFTGNKDKAAAFTPVRSYSGLSKSYREQLSALKITPSSPGAPAEITSAIAPPRRAAQTGTGAQLTR